MKKYVFESLKFFCAAILCTILSAFASPSWGANCNLFDINSVQIASTGYDYTINNNSFVVTAKSGTTEASRISFYIDAKKFKENTKYYFYSKSDKSFSQARLNIGKATLNSSSNNSAYGTLHSKIDNGYAGVFKITTIAPDQEYVSFFYYLGEQPEGTQITISDIMIIEGDTATEYTPYNPLCATCDGTMVNYTSATGTGVQNGTPTPDNPIEPTFYTQGDMVLRKVGTYADSYDASTGKITRRVGVAVLDGSESWTNPFNNGRYVLSFQKVLRYGTGANNELYCSHFKPSIEAASNLIQGCGFYTNTGAADVPQLRITYPDMPMLSDFKSWLAAQKAAGTPVTIYYPLAEETTEDWPASYCETPIKIATTKYNETAFGPLNTALQNAISVVDTVVSNTITQAASIATLQTQKQTRPNDIADDSEKCPAGKKCLLVTDTSGVPHWYEIVERYSRLPDGYTELQWIQSTGSQWVNTEYKMTSDIVEYGIEIYGAPTSSTSLFGSETSSGITYSGVPYASGSSVSVFIGRSSSLSGMIFPASQWNTYTIKTTSATNLSVTLNGNTRDGVYSGGIQKEKPLYLFANNNDGNTQKASIRVRSFYIKDNGALVRDFVPAQNSDGKIGMYDLANGVFYENAGDGEFIAGPVSE